MPMFTNDRTYSLTVLQLCIANVLITIVSSQTCSVADPNVFPNSTEMTVFSSPGYNAGTGTYSADMNCFWLIDSGAADLKLLLFMTYDTSCPGDKIFIYDGNANTDLALANGVCGTPSAPTPYSTTQQYARVEMVSDSSIEKAGFQIDVVAAKDYSGTGCTATQSITATSSYQMLTSPNFPDKYPSNSNCRWALTSPDGYLELDVIVSDVEDDDPTSCDYDKYLIYDGANKCDNNNIKMICSEYPKVTSYSNNSTESTVTVTLESDGSVNRRGFMLRFRSVSTATTTIPTTTTVATTTAFIAAISSTTTRSSDGKLLEMNMELLVGVVFGSLLLISFTIVTVVVVVKKVAMPLEKTITPVQPYRPRPQPPETQPRPRRSNGSTKRNSLPNGHKTQATGIGTTRIVSAW